jgi:hypothetical protein
MILESAQMLSTCVNLMNGSQVAPYKNAHPKHPCTLWVMESKANFLWLCELAKELHEEFKHRRGKSHKSYEVVKFCENNIPNFDKQELTPFAQAMDDEYKHKDTVKAYRNYYKRGKQHLHQWTNREQPNWI